MKAKGIDNEPLLKLRQNLTCIDSSTLLIDD